MKKPAYTQAGVDIDHTQQLKKTLPKLIQTTHRPEVLGNIGHFAGLFRLPKNYRHPTLVASIDGVGTKLKIATLANQHHTIGQDLVNHCVNDIAVLGAQPLFFLDHLAAAHLPTKTFKQILTGITRACRQNHCALLGGETAQIPDTYQKNDYDLNGAIIGIIEQNQILTGKNIQPGDTILALPSNGLHTNGYTLARKILLQKLKLKPHNHIPGTNRTLTQELLRIHPTYLKPIQQLIQKFNPPRRQPAIKALAHITGGGLIDNLPRILPPNTDAHIHTNRWKPQPIFQLLQQTAQIPLQEMHRTFNMGIGITAIIPTKKTTQIQTHLKQNRQPSIPIGTITHGTQKCHIH